MPIAWLDPAAAANPLPVERKGSLCQSSLAFRQKAARKAAFQALSTDARLCETVLSVEVTTVTADKTNATIQTPDMIAPGMRINAVGGDCPGKTELHADILERANVFVEYEPQTRIEGDIQQMAPDFVVTELWRVLAGTAAGRRSDADVTVFDSVGFALEDLSALTFVRDMAAQLGIGSSVGLIPSTPDPKNLFGVLEAQAAEFTFAALA